LKVTLQTKCPIRYEKAGFFFSSFTFFIMHNISSYSSLANNANSSVSAEREQTITYMDNLRKRKDGEEKKQTVAYCFTKILCCGQT
jgi:hypothetical protein